MTMTGPKSFDFTLGGSSFAFSATGRREPVCRATTMSRSAAAASTRRPTTSRAMSGRNRRRYSLASTGWRVKRSVSSATYARTRARLTDTVSGTVVPGAATSASSTALWIAGVPICSGDVSKRWSPKVTTSGSAYSARTCSNATSGGSPPTGPRRRRERVERGDASQEDSWVVTDDSVGSPVLQAARRRRVVDGPRPNRRAGVVASANRSGRHEGVMDDRGRRTGPCEPPAEHSRQRRLQRTKADRDRGCGGAVARDSQAVLRVRQADAQPRLVRAQVTQRRVVEGADERLLEEPVPPHRVCDARLEAALLEVDVRPDARLAEERERVVERRPVPRQLERRVRQDEVAPVLDHVELHVVDADVDRRTQRLQRVLRRERSRATVADSQRATVTPEERHGRVGSGVSSSRPPCAAYATIMRSVIHSTGEWSSVHGSPRASDSRNPLSRRSRNSASASGARLVGAVESVATTIRLKRSACQ